MRILAINNYSLEDAYKLSIDKIQPSHHCWGIDYFRQSGYHVDTMQFQFRSSTSLIKIIELVWFNLKILFNIYKYDTIISFAYPLIHDIAFLKYIHFLPRRIKLYTFIHHVSPVRPLGYDKVFFLSNSIKLLSEKRFPSLVKKSVYIKWGGDAPFYSVKPKDIKRHIVMSNGKSHRDNELLLDVCKDLGLRCVVITDKITVNGNDIIMSNVKGENALSYKDMLEIVQDATILAVPVRKEIHSGSLCGLTSFIDGCLLGCPLLLSDNTNIGVNVEEERMGYIYEAGNRESMKKQLSNLISNENDYHIMSSNCLSYGRRYDYLAYCNKLLKEIKE